MNLFSASVFEEQYYRNCEIDSILADTTEKENFANSSNHADLKSENIANSGNADLISEISQLPQCQEWAANYFPKHLTHNGHQFIRNNIDLNKNSYTIRFRCSKYRTHECPAIISEKVPFTVDLPSQTQIKIQHSDKCLGNANTFTQQGAIDIKDEMTKLVQNEALENPGKRARIISEEIAQQMNLKYYGQAYLGLTKEEVTNLVFNTRGNDVESIEQLLRTPPLSQAGLVIDGNLTDARPFLQSMWQGFIKNNGKYEYHKIFIWGHPDLIYEIQGQPVQLFIDCTFKVPKGWMQIMIIMLFHSKTGLYVPIFYILMTGKFADLYNRAIQEIISITDWRLDVQLISHDFEAAEIKVFKLQFPKAICVGCLFHFVKANKEQMMKSGIPKDIAGFVCSSIGPLQILTHISRQELESKGLPYFIHWLTKHQIYNQHLKHWNSYFIYFKKTWLNLYAYETWNIYHLIQDDKLRLLSNRTNNPLESYNRQFKNLFSASNPNMAHYVEQLKSEANRYVQRIEEIKKDRASFIERDAVRVTLPDEYVEFTI